MDRKYTIAVAGTGYVGLSIATLLSQNNKVYAVDIIPEKVELINQRKSPIQDEYIEKYLAENELDLTATLDAETAYKDAEFVVVAAPTNYDSKTQHFDTSAVEAVIKLRDELNAKCTAPSERDWGRLEERIHTEVLEARSLLHKVKQIEWWELTEPQLYTVRREMRCILNRIEYYTVEHIRGWDIGPQREQIKKMNENKALLGIEYSRRELEKYL